MKNINVDPFDESTNTASTTDNNDSKLPYVSPSPGEFPIIGSTICVDKDNPTREEFVTARECGFSAGSSPVKYINNDSDVASSVLTTKFKPAMLNTGIGLLVNNASLIAYTTDHYPFNDPAVVKSYKIRMNYTVQQPFVTGLGLADEPHWHDDVPKDPDGKMDFIGFVDSGDPLDDKTGYVPAIFTNIYWVTENEMISKCNLNNVPYRQLHINLAASASSDYIGTMKQ